MVIPFPFLEVLATDCDDNVNLRLQIAVMKGDPTAVEAILKCPEEQGGNSIDFKNIMKILAKVIMKKHYELTSCQKITITRGQ